MAWRYTVKTLSPKLSASMITFAGFPSNPEEVLGQVRGGTVTLGPRERKEGAIVSDRTGRTRSQAELFLRSHVPTLLPSPLRGTEGPWSGSFTWLS